MEKLLSIPRKKLIFSGKVLLVLLAVSYFLSELLEHSHDHGHGHGIENFWAIPVFLVAGFFFGKLTCSAHLKSAGFWITFSLFAVLNLVHSAIDGVILIGLEGPAKHSAVLFHEIIRQPALYVILWAMLAPFNNSKRQKILISIGAITGVWILGMILGHQTGEHLEHLHFVELLAGNAIFLFIGDIIHHLYDEAKGLGILKLKN